MNLKRLTFLCGIVLLALPLQAGKVQDWAKAFSGDKVQKQEFNNYDFFFFPTCTVPGAKAAEAAKTSRFDDFEAEAPATDADSLMDQLENFKDTKEYYEEMVKGTEEKIKALGEDGNQAEKEFLEEDLKVAKTMLENGLDLATVSKYTGLSYEQLEALRGNKSTGRVSGTNSEN